MDKKRRSRTGFLRVWLDYFPWPWVDALYASNAVATRFERAG